MLYFFMSKDSYRAALFLDRDGVIIKAHGYVGKISDVSIDDNIEGGFVKENSDEPEKE